METSTTSTQFALPPLLERAYQRAQQLQRPVLARLPAHHPWKDPWAIATIAAQSGEFATLWADPDRRFEAVGIGEADRVCVHGAQRLSRLQRALQQRGEDAIAHETQRALPLWFGGFAFQENASAHGDDDTWRAWREDSFVTHEITALRADNQSHLVLTIRVDPGAARAHVQQQYERLLGIVASIRAISGSAPAQAPIALDFHDDQGRDGWLRQVDAARDAIHAGDLQKVVLARRIRARWPDQRTDVPAPLRILPALENLRARYAHCTTFAIVTPADDAGGAQAFFGATPELLIARQADRVRTMALAGTTRRGDTPEDDRRREYALLASEKERTEHQLVVQDIVESLATIDITVRPSPAPDVVSFPNVHHLCTPIHAPAPEHVGILEIAQALHPTPAVCGTPGDAAYAWLVDKEPLDRGRYAGGVGWLNDQMEGRISVALRTALATDDGVSAFAGAGIVDGSNAEHEWEETYVKLATIRDAFQPSDEPTADTSHAGADPTPATSAKDRP